MPFQAWLQRQCRSSLYLLCQRAPAMHIIVKSCMSYLNTVPSPPNVKTKIPLNSLPPSVCSNLFMLVWLAFISRTHRQRHSISQQYVFWQTQYLPILQAWPVTAHSSWQQLSWSVIPEVFLEMLTMQKDQGKNFRSRQRIRNVLHFSPKVFS